MPKVSPHLQSEETSSWYQKNWGPLLPAEWNSKAMCLPQGAHNRCRGDWRLWFIPSEANSDFWCKNHWKKQDRDNWVRKGGHTPQRDKRGVLWLHQRPKTGPQMSTWAASFWEASHFKQGQKSLCLPCTGYCEELKLKISAELQVMWPHTDHN